MRRNLLHICLALLTFTIGFLSSGTYEGLTAALLFAFVIVVSLQKIARLNPNLHHLKVALLTLLLWLPVAALVIYALPKPGSCVIDFTQEETKPLREADKKESVMLLTPTLQFSMNTDVSEGDDNVKEEEATNTIWAGVVDKKAISKPAPAYPALADLAGISSTVAVAVVIDPAGEVIEARAISGHPLLRRAATEAAYQARFESSGVCGMPPYVSGVLTYRFGL